jgi:hypothetical protein
MRKLQMNAYKVDAIVTESGLSILAGLVGECQSQSVG